MRHDGPAPPPLSVILTAEMEMETEMGKGNEIQISP